MSASIYYRPVDPNKGTNLNVSSPSKFLQIMEKCFGDPPLTLEKNDILILSGMATAWLDEKDNPFTILIEEIERNGSIEIWTMY